MHALTKGIFVVDNTCLWFCAFLSQFVTVKLKFRSGIFVVDNIYLVVIWRISNPISDSKTYIYVGNCTASWSSAYNYYQYITTKISSNTYKQTRIEIYMWYLTFLLYLSTVHSCKEKLITICTVSIC